MSRVAVKGLLFRRGRTILTAIAIVLGVAMVSGTYVLTDTISHGLRQHLQLLLRTDQRGDLRPERRLSESPAT